MELTIRASARGRLYSHTLFLVAQFAHRPRPQIRNTASGESLTGPEGWRFGRCEVYFELDRAARHAKLPDNPISITHRGVRTYF